MTVDLQMPDGHVINGGQSVTILEENTCIYWQRQSEPS